MHYLHFMQALQPLSELNEYSPDLGLRQLRPPLAHILYLPQQVSIVRIFHNDAQGLGGFVKKGCSIADDVFVADGGKEADLVQSVLSFFFVQP